MKVIYIPLILIGFLGCWSKDSPTNSNLLLGLEFDEFYSLIEKGLNSDSILFEKKISYFREGQDTIFGEPFDNLVLNMRTSNTKQNLWSLDPVFYNDRLLSIELINKEFSGITEAQELFEGYLGFDLRSSNDEYEISIDELEPIGIRLLMTKKSLKYERDSLYKIDYRNIMWNEFDDSWSTENHEDFKNDLPKQRIEKYKRYK